MLTITEGTKVGLPFHLLDWHKFVAGSLFGWRKTSGRMRFRSAWLETGKGQAKSPFMAAIGLYMTGFYGVARARAFAIGQDKATANVLFKDAVAKRLYMGIPLGSNGFWIAEEAWQAVQGKVDRSQMRGRPCWLSLDLSKKNDLTALTVVWIGDDGHLYAKTWYWTTQQGLADRSRADQTPYDQWAEKTAETCLTAVPGAVIDKTFVAAEVKRICQEHEVEFLAFDPAGMADFMAACEEIGFEVWKFEHPDKPEGIGLKLVNHAQGPRVRFEDRQLTMPRSIEKLEDRILQKTITIDASPVTYSCAANAMTIADGQENRAFDKKQSRGRIDGMVTIAMAVGAADNELGGEPSVYESRGLLTV